MSRDFFIEALVKRVDILEKQVAELQNPPIASERRVSEAEASYAGLIPRGKYQGRHHDDIVHNDPWYVQWLVKENKAAGLGFTEEQCQAACDDPRPDPRQRR